jgi:redox-sensitive bicupin YhaK (pirin superfamily)
MIDIIPSAKRHHSDAGWLSTYWHFSFSDYYDPKNMNWGDLRVFNDDVIQGGGGFGMHPHRDMEIITYVVKGQLEHQDHLGNKGLVHPGEVQVMSAGRGIMHAEYNASKTEPVHLMQLWVIPRKKGNAPRWEQKQFTPEQRQGKLLPVVSSGNLPGTLAIDQDAAIYVSSLKPGEEVAHENKGSHAYLFVISGNATLNGKPLAKGDQARVASEKKLEIRAETDAELILLDLP